MKTNRKNSIISIIVAVLVVFAMMPMTAVPAYAADPPECTVVIEPGFIGGASITVRSKDEGRLVIYPNHADNGQFEWNESLSTLYYRYPNCPDSFNAPEGVAFAGWTSTAREDMENPGFYINANDDTITLTAQWKVTVSFDSNGGSGDMDSETAVLGTEYTIPECRFTPPDGKAFSGWNTVAKGTPGNYGTWYYPGDKITPEADMTLYARWSDPLLSICSYDYVNSKSAQGGKFTLDDENGYFSGRWSYGCNNYTVSKGSKFTVTAAPDNGYAFDGWYKGKYIRQDEQGNPVQDAVPCTDPWEWLAFERMYDFTVTDNTVLCPVFYEAPLVNFVDIGNIWTRLDPVNDIPFTGEVNPNEEGLSDFIEITEEAWTSTDGESVLTSSDHAGTLAAGKTYQYSVKIAAKGENTFDSDNGFRFIYGGTEYAFNDLTVTFSQDKKTATISGFVPNQTVTAVDLKDAVVSGISAKTYTGKAQTQSPTVKTKVNGTPFTLKNGTDYRVTYKNNTNAGTATITITGKGNYKGSVSRKFTISKAANPLAVQGKTVAVKLSDLKQKNQKLAVKEVIKTTKKGQGTVTYALSSAKKGSKSFKKYFKVNKTTGKVTVKKGLKKGKYKVKINVTASGNGNYKKATKPVTVTIRVK